MELDPKYKFVKDHEKHLEIHDSSDGKSFKIAKKNLHPATQLHIFRNMQKFDGGGSVMDDPDANPPQTGFDPSMQDSIPQSPQQSPSIPEIGAQAPQSQDQPTAPAPQPMPQVGGQPIPGKTPDVMSQFLANQGLEEKGLQAQGNALAAQGTANAKAYTDANQKIAKYLEASNQSIDAMGAQNDILAQEAAKTNIDPKAYFHNMNTGQKIGNAIALIIGGIGAGMTHGPNMALETMNRAIDRDIESQKINLGKKQSLLSLNLAKYKDMRAAQTATMMQMNAILQGQIAANSAKYGGIAGQAGTQSLLGQLKNKNLEDSMNLKQQVFQLGLQQHLAGGDVANDNPLDYVRWVVPADKQKEVTTEIGKAAYAAKNHEHLMNLWDQAQKEQTMLKTGFGLFDAPATRELKTLTDPLIKDSEGRITPMESEHLQGVFPSSGQTDKRQKELRNGFERFVMGKQEAPMAKAYGIDINKFNDTRMAPKGQGVERVFKSGPDKGRIGIFDENTKKFLGYKK